MNELKTFHVTFQDKALNRYVVTFEAESWEDVIIMAFSRKKPDEKLLYIQQIKGERK